MPSRHKGSDASSLAFLPPGALEAPGGPCFLEWSPYLKDRTMGLNHQAASLSCALGEAFFLNRTLLLPDSICLFALHTERWRGAGQPSGEVCVPLGEVWDVPLLSQLVPIHLVPHNLSAAAAAATTTMRGGRAAASASAASASGSVVSVGKSWTSARVRSQYPCHPASPTERRVLLVRRQVESFWFQQCTRRITDHRSLAQRVNELLGAPASAPRPMNILLRAGLFFARHIKEAAAAVQAHIGGSYVSLHVRRSDKLTACTPEECKTRDEATRPAALLRALDLWFPRGTHVYIGSTERPAYFELLRERYTLHFAEDYSQELNNVTRGAVSNNYALYALETLLFFGSQASVETFSYQTSWFVDACFPAAATRRAIAPAGAAQRGAAGAVRVECRDRGGVRVNGVLYGRACLENAPCGRAQHLVPQPESCGLQLANQTMRARAGAMRPHSGAATCATPWLAAAPGDEPGGLAKRWRRSVAKGGGVAKGSGKIGRKTAKGGGSGKGGGGKGGGGKGGGGKGSGVAAGKGKATFGQRDLRKTTRLEEEIFGRV